MNVQYIANKYTIGSSKLSISVITASMTHVMSVAAVNRAQSSTSEMCGKCRICSKALSATALSNVSTSAPSVPCTDFTDLGHFVDPKNVPTVDAYTGKSLSEWNGGAHTATDRSVAHPDHQQAGKGRHWMQSKRDINP